MDSARYQQVRQDIIENWIKSLSKDQMADLAAMAFEVKQEEGRRMRTIFISPNNLREALLKVSRGEDLDVIWMAGAVDEAS